MDIDKWLEEYDRKHPIKSKLINLAVKWDLWFTSTWLHAWYFGRHWGYMAPCCIPEGTPPPIYIRRRIRKMQRAGFNPLWYTWADGEHTFIFATEDEAERAFQCYKNKYMANWGHIGHKKVTEELLKYSVPIRKKG